MKRRRTELTDSLMGPKISSILPIWVLLCRYIGALKKGIFSYVSFVTASPSHAWTNDETSAHTKKKKKKNPLHYLLLKLHYFNKTQTITMKPNRPTTSEGGPSSRKPLPPPWPPKWPPLKPPPRPPSQPPLKPPPPPNSSMDPRLKPQLQSLLRRSPNSTSSTPSRRPTTLPGSGCGGWL